MAVRHVWLEITTCCRGVHRFVCVLVLPSGDPCERITAKLMVTTSTHVLVNMADDGDDLDLEGEVVAVKRSSADNKNVDINRKAMQSPHP